MAVICYSRSYAVASSHQSFCGNSLLSACLLYIMSDVAALSLSGLDLLREREIAIWFIAFFSFVSLKTTEELKKKERERALFSLWQRLELSLL